VKKVILISISVEKIRTYVFFAYQSVKYSKTEQIEIEKTDKRGKKKIFYILSSLVNIQISDFEFFYM